MNLTSRTALEAWGDRLGPMSSVLAALYLHGVLWGWYVPNLSSASSIALEFTGGILGAALYGAIQFFWYSTRTVRGKIADVEDLVFSIPILLVVVFGFWKHHEAFTTWGSVNVFRLFQFTMWFVFALVTVYDIVTGLKRATK